jgi:hypothetical protein
MKNSVLIAMRGPSGIISSLAVITNLRFTAFSVGLTSLFGISELLCVYHPVFLSRHLRVGLPAS